MTEPKILDASLRATTVKKAADIALRRPAKNLGGTYAAIGREKQYRPMHGVSIRVVELHQIVHEGIGKPYRSKNPESCPLAPPGKH